MRNNVYGLVFSFVLLIVLFGCTQAQDGGRVVFTMKDAAADMGSVQKVEVTIDSVSVHTAAEGWTTVSSTSATYDLLTLKAEGNQVVLADVQLKEGTYNQVRLDISKVVVTDADGEHEAKLPSGELKIVGDVEVKENTTSAATFDFIVDESLHMTGNGQYIMAPVVQFESRTDAVVDVSGGSVRVTGGQVKTNVKVGMDVDGNVGIGLGIADDAELDIENGRVSIKLSLGSSGSRSSSVRSNASAEGSVAVGDEVAVGANVDASASY